MNALLALLALLLAVLAASQTGCATAPPMPPPDRLFHDTAFAPPASLVDPAAALAISPAMHRFVEARLAPGVRRGQDPRRLLIDALYRKDGLQLEYDARTTRTAAQAFEAREGNCLALVMMTAAFARDLGLPVRFQSITGEASWERAGDMVVSVGHVNIALDDRPPRSGKTLSLAETMVVDFLPSPDAARLPARTIAERTVVAMYLNNRAVETLQDRRPIDAYWWARHAIQEDPDFLPAYLTLGVVYRETGHLDWADEALGRVADREPDNPDAMTDRILVLRDQGRLPEADLLARRLARLDPHPPFSYFEAGLAAYREGRYEAARRLFDKEVQRAPDRHEFEFWLAASCAQLNRMKEARDHLARALAASSARADRDLYAGKLERLKALGVK